MASFEAWVQSHEQELGEIATEDELAPELVRLAVGLVLAGADDDEIFTRLRSSVISPDGQHSPIGDAPDAVARIRLLVLTG